MSTSSFTKIFEFTDPEVVERLRKIMSDETPAKPIGRRSEESREAQRRGEELLKKCRLRRPKASEETKGE